MNDQAYIDEQFFVPNPGAGRDWQYIVPGDGIDRMVVAIGTTFTAVGAGNRIVSIQVKDPSGASVALVTAPAAYTGTNIYQTQIVSGNPGYSSGQGGLLATLTLPRLWLPAGYSIQSLTNGIGATDAWSNLLVALAHQPHMA